MLPLKAKLLKSPSQSLKPSKVQNKEEQFQKSLTIRSTYVYVGHFSWKNKRPLVWVMVWNNEKRALMVLNYNYSKPFSANSHCSRLLSWIRGSFLASVEDPWQLLLNEQRKATKSCIQNIRFRESCRPDAITAIAVSHDRKRKDSD